MHRKRRFLASMLVCSLTVSVWGCGADLSDGKEKGSADLVEESQTEKNIDAWKKALPLPMGNIRSW